MGLEMGCRCSQGCSIESCKRQPLTDLVLGRTNGINPELGREFASCSVRGAVLICWGIVWGSCGASPAAAWLAGAPWGRLITAGSRRGFVQGKDCVCGTGKANRVKGRVMLCTQEPAGKPQITDIFPSTCQEQCCFQWLPCTCCRLPILLQVLGAAVKIFVFSELL